jgi:hypothetical protein
MIVTDICELIMNIPAGKEQKKTSYGVITLACLVQYSTGISRLTKILLFMYVVADHHHGFHPPEEIGFVELHPEISLSQATPYLTRTIQSGLFCFV